MDVALRKYNKNTPEEEKTPEGLAYAMRVGTKEKTDKLNVKMMKLVAVANPSSYDKIFGRGRFHEHIIIACWIVLDRSIIGIYIVNIVNMRQVEKHWSAKEVLEMTLEKLLMVATCNTTHFDKIKFLKWWNSSIPSRDARYFPPRPVAESLLGLFLNRCVWYVGVSV